MNNFQGRPFRQKGNRRRDLSLLLESLLRLSPPLRAFGIGDYASLRMLAVHCDQPLLLSHGVHQDGLFCTSLPLSEHRVLDVRWLTGSETAALRSCRILERQSMVNALVIRRNAQARVIAASSRTVRAIAASKLAFQASSARSRF
jgi:hypothetical protein